MRYECVPPPSLVRAVLELASQGVRRLLVTSTGSGEGKTTVVATLGRALVADARASVVLLDADAFDPALHRSFGLGIEHGLGDLLETLYGVDLGHEDPDQFGLGDWVELLRAQQLTGELGVNDDRRSYSLRFVKGAPCGIAATGDADAHRLGELLVARGQVSPAARDHALEVQRETGRPFGDVLCTLGELTAEQLAPALREQWNHRLQELMRVRPCRCRFTELAESWRAVIGGRAPALACPGAMKELLDANVRAYLGDPFLATQIPGYLGDTDSPGLKVLPAGTRPTDLMSVRHAVSLELLLERLGRMFEFVIVDAPPASLLAPTAALAAAVDGVLMVVQAGRFETAEIRRAIEQLLRAGARVVGTVLTHAGAPQDTGPSPRYRVPAGARPQLAGARP